jgi:hypothetical protein
MVLADIICIVFQVASIFVPIVITLSIVTFSVW